MGGKSFQVPCFETRTRVPFFSRLAPLFGSCINFFLSNIWQPFSIDCRGSTRVRPPRRGGHHGRAQASKPGARPALLAAVKAVGPVSFWPPDSAVLVIREGYVRLDGWCSRAHVSSRMVSRASELAILFLIQ